MSDPDLKRLLGVAVSTDRPARDPEIDVMADLTRARTAARDRRARRLRMGTSALALGAMAAVGLTQVAGQPDRPGGSTSASADGRVHLVAATFDADPYTFDLTPKGWHVQAQSPFGVTIAPDDGTTSEDPDDFAGKLVILFDANPPDGRYVVDEGRGFWVSRDSGYTTIATRARAGEPAGVVRVQYPDDSGWTRPTMLRFLGSVHVGAGARHGQG